MVGECVDVTRLDASVVGFPQARPDIARDIVRVYKNVTVGIVLQQVLANGGQAQVEKAAGETKKEQRTAVLCLCISTGT